MKATVSQELRRESVRLGWEDQQAVERRKHGVGDFAKDPVENDGKWPSQFATPSPTYMAPITSASTFVGEAKIAVPSFTPPGGLWLI